MVVYILTTFGCHILAGTSIMKILLPEQVDSYSCVVLDMINASLVISIIIEDELVVGDFFSSRDTAHWTSSANPV